MGYSQVWGQTMSDTQSSATVVRQLPLLEASGLAPAAEPAVPDAAPPFSPTQLRDAVAAFCLHLSNDSRAPHSVRSTELDLRGLLEHLGDTSLADIAPTQLAAHIRWLRTD